MISPSKFRPPPLTEKMREKKLKAALELLQVQRKLSSGPNGNILHYILKEQSQFLSLEHYPQGDRIDFLSGAQYFYHCHREDLQSEEHGHFHLFLRHNRISPRLQPTPLPDWDRYIENPMTHLVSISINRHGQPIRLFTVNRWVSEEICYDARHIPLFLQQFKLRIRTDLYWSPVDKWIEGLVELFSAQIEWLHEERDRKIQARAQRFPGRNVYEDRRLEELSEIKINLGDQVAWLSA